MAYYRAFIWLCIYLMLVIVTIAGYEDKNCDRSKCPVPMAHYIALNCKPEYEVGRCCPVKFNCDQLYERMNLILHKRMNNKCYFNGSDYELGEMIGEEDQTFCGKVCRCVNTEDDIADFNCNCEEACAISPSKNGCYLRSSREQCCPEEVCPNAPEDSSACRWNDVNYSLGELVVPRHKPTKLCVCEERSTGPPMIMCEPFNHWFDMHAAYYFYKGCAPVYHVNKRGFTGIHTQTWRCQNANDIVYDKNYLDPESKESRDAHGPLPAIYCPKQNCGWFSCDPLEPCMAINKQGRYAVTYEPTYRELCRFGQMTMHIGDRLHDIEYGNNSCISCTCVIPPVPTCTLKEKESCTFHQL